jgi:hypothetical protein
MARALSVSAWNGSQRAWARNPIGSARGTVSRGYCFATASGAEKSRHRRQDASSFAAARTATASIWEADGRELRGTAGAGSRASLAVVGRGGGVCAFPLAVPFLENDEGFT